MNYYNLVKVNDVLLQIIRDFNPDYFVTDKTSDPTMEQIGLWVQHLGGDRVVRKDNRILICRTIQDAEII